MFTQAAQIIREAEVFIISAGAGMGVDSGLPDFRGVQGFWNAYPAYADRGLSFIDCADPGHFAHDPGFGWGFYGHRTNLYRTTQPHEGFYLISKWIQQNCAEYFVVTSNVDGQFQKAGYDDGRILEVHGSIHWLQCLTPCSNNIWPNNETIIIDEDTMRARGNLPHCPECGEISRPNILMFNDNSWLPDRTTFQERNFNHFMSENADRRIVVIETGAGSSIPTIRKLSEQIGSNYKQASVIRINPRESHIKSPQIPLPFNALEGLRKIDQLLAAK